jgi:hypothetical protein
LDGDGDNGLRTREINGSFPAFINEVAIDLKIVANALNDLEVDVVQGCSAWDKVFSHPLIADAYLQPLIPAQVIGNSALAALTLAPDPIAEELAFVGISLPLNVFKVVEVATDTARGRGISGDCLGAHVQLRNAWHMGKVRSRSIRRAPGSVNGETSSCASESA